MRELCSWNYVADRENARLSRFVIFIDLDRASLRNLDLRVLKAEAFKIRHTADRNEQHFGLERNGFALRILTRNLDALLALFHLVELEAGLDLDALLFEGALKLF